MAKTKEKKTNPIEGEALLQKVKELGTLSREEKAKACGYYTRTKKGVERVNLMQFLNSLMDAEGIILDGKKGEKEGRVGRNATFKISVQTNGNLLIGSAYTKQMGLKPGDEFEISLGRKHIHLKQIEGGAPDSDIDGSEDTEEED